MASKRKHDKAIIWGAVPLVFAGAVAGVYLKWYLGGGFDPLPVVLAPLGSLSGLWLSPDNDLRSRLFMRPYAWGFAHREALSHGFLIGTAGRLLYLLSLFMVSYACIGAAYGWGPLQFRLSLFLVYGGGLVLADAFHLALDGFRIRPPTRRGAVFMLATTAIVLVLWPIVFTMEV